MSLLSEQMTTCTILDRRTVDDGYGGVDEQYVAGATIQAAIPLMSAIDRIAAQQSQPKSTYHIITTKAVMLQYHDVIRREEDGKIFRVTSDGSDNKTPNSAGLNMRVVDAEEWRLPT